MFGEPSRLASFFNMTCSPTEVLRAPQGKSVLLLTFTGRTTGVSKEMAEKLVEHLLCFTFH